MMPRTVSTSDGSLIVSGVSLVVNRDEASTAKPKQCPDDRAWLIILAHAAASAVRTQGSATASTQILSLVPNISVTSAASKLIPWN